MGTYRKAYKRSQGMYNTSIICTDNYHNDGYISLAIPNCFEVKMLSINFIIDNFEDYNKLHTILLGNVILILKDCLG